MISFSFHLHLHEILHSLYHMRKQKLWYFVRFNETDLTLLSIEFFLRNKTPVMDRKLAKFRPVGSNLTRFQSRIISLFFNFNFLCFLMLKSMSIFSLQKRIIKINQSNFYPLFVLEDLKIKTFLSDTSFIVSIFYFLYVIIDLIW